MSGVAVDAVNLVRDVWKHDFPSPELVKIATGLFTKLPAWDGREELRSMIAVSPGTIGISTHDVGKLARTYERGVKAQQMRSDFDANEMNAGVPLAFRSQLGIAVDDCMVDPSEVETRKPRNPVREVTCWSPKSRRLMSRRLRELDYSPLANTGLIPALCTTTLPGDWQVVAPTGKRFKQLVHNFQMRWEREWGTRLTGIWKLEFQKRGAPHLHFMTTPPWRLSAEGERFPQWFSRVWAEVVNHPDPVERMKHERVGTNVEYADALRMVDPQSVAAYFAGYGLSKDKEYQHRVPARVASAW